MAQQQSQIDEQIQKFYDRERQIAEKERNHFHLEQDYQEQIAALQKQIVWQTSVAAIGEAHLNKWRKHNFSS